MIGTLLGKKAAPFLIAAALALGAAGLFFLGVETIDGWIETARVEARKERDNYWRAEIEKSNAAAQAKIADNLRTTMAVQQRASEDVAAAEARATELEKSNAALPDNGDRGLRRERVRLLNQR